MDTEIEEFNITAKKTINYNIEVNKWPQKYSRRRVTGEPQANLADMMDRTWTSVNVQ